MAAFLAGLLAREINRGSGQRPSFNFDFLLKKLHCKEEDNVVIKSEGWDIPPLSCKFCPSLGQENVLAVSDEDGNVVIINTEHLRDKHKVLMEWDAHSNAVFDVSWSPYGTELLTASGDHMVRHWDVPCKKQIGSFLGHKGTVRCVEFRSTDKAIFATGSRDGDIMLWDIRSHVKSNSPPEMIISGGHNEATVATTKKGRKVNKSSSCGSNSVTSVIFKEDYYLISSGAADGAIKVWDLRKSYNLYKREPRPLYRFPYTGESTKAHGFTNLKLDYAQNNLFASCTDSKIYRFNCASYSETPVGVYYGHCVNSFFVKIDLSPDEQFLISGSSDKLAYIWRVKQNGDPILRLEGHTEEVTSVAWNKRNPSKVVTCGDDNRVLLWSSEGYKEDTKLIGKCITVDTSSLKKTFQQASILHPATPKTPVSRLCSTPSSSRKTVNNRLLSTPSSSKSVSRLSNTKIVDWFTKSPCLSQTPVVPSTTPCNASNSALSRELVFATPNKRSPPKPTPETPSSSSANKCILSPKKNCDNVNYQRRRIFMDDLNADVKEEVKDEPSSVELKQECSENRENVLKCDGSTSNIFSPSHHLNMAAADLVTPPRSTPQTRNSRVGKTQKRRLSSQFKKTSSEKLSQKAKQSIKRELMQTKPITSYFSR